MDEEALPRTAEYETILSAPDHGRHPESRAGAGLDRPRRFAGHEVVDGRPDQEGASGDERDRRAGLKRVARLVALLDLEAFGIALERPVAGLAATLLRERVDLAVHVARLTARRERQAHA